tara:strand:+ start:67777 stop:69150 length:1374 start_codon:yes stop_codon:yes gene_type:complete
MSLKYDICIIGAGSAGLTMAAVSASLGHKVALVESHKMGGDCLNYGCVPSKALLHCAKAGITDFQQVNKHIKHAIASIAPHDSVERFKDLGCDVYQEKGIFKNATTLQVGSKRIKAKRFVIATGASTFIPPIQGLENVPFLTNETIFNLKTCPSTLTIIGGGAIGVEMAFAFRKLGAQVTMIESAPCILAQSDKDAVQIIRQELLNMGVKIHENVVIEKIMQEGVEIAVRLEEKTISSTHLLIATGRKANLENLNLKAANIHYNAKGIHVDKTLRTNQKHIYAIGDCASKLQFTHVASFEASVVIKRVLFGLMHSKVKYNAVPRVLYTSPELAETGISQQQAIQTYGEDNIKTVMVPYADVHRAVCDDKTLGFAKIILKNNGTVLGACIVGEQAGELITAWTTLITYKRKISDLSGVTVPYPTYSEINKQAASLFYKNSFYSSKVQKLSKWLFKYLG